jgi:hypothetical protein
LDGHGPLICIDIVNSQPLIMGLALKTPGGELSRAITEYQTHLPKANRSQRRARGERKGVESGQEEATPYLAACWGGCQSDDLDRYIGLCREGEIYEVLLDAVRRDGRRGEYDRDRIKRRLFAVLYGQPRHSGTRVGSAFKSLFPGVWAGVEALNLRGVGLARQMQLVESYVVFWRACGRLMHDYPHAPLLTITTV